MSQLTLILFIILFVLILVYVVHLYDKYLVKEINEYESRLEKKGILKRHFTKKIDDK
tara:strand:- start:220 stop:390 length:171 start_codon:yes stop_codon:yes gene_type:complete